MTTDRETGVMAVVRALPEDARLLLQLAAILYEPVSTTFLCRAFLSLDHFFSAERRPRYDEAQALIGRLREQGLLSTDNQCAPDLAELLTRESVREKRFARLAAFVEQTTPAEYRHSRPEARCRRILRRFRIGLHSGDAAMVEEALAALGPPDSGACATLFPGMPPVAAILSSAFDPAWFAALPVFLQFSLLNHVVEGNLALLSACPALENYLEREVPVRLAPEERLPFARLLAKLHIARGRADALARLEAENRELFAGSGLGGTAAFLRGDFPTALALFRQDLNHLGRILGMAEPALFGLPGFLHAVLCLHQMDSGSDTDTAELAAARARLAAAIARLKEPEAEAPELLPLECLAALAARLAGETPDLLPLGSALAGETHKIALLLSLLVFHWLGVSIAPEFVARLERIRAEAEAAGYGWIAAEAAGLLAALAGEPHSPSPPAAVSPLKEGASASLPLRGRWQREALTEGVPPTSAILTRLFKPATDWRHSLTELIEAVQEARQADPDRRLAWFVHYERGALALLPKEQRKNAQGRWSAGRALSLPRLAAEEQPWFSGQDRALRAALITGASGLPTFDAQKALPALIGHPLVFLGESPKTPVEVVAGEPELMVERRGESLFLHFAEPLSEAEYSVRPETPTRFKVLRIRPEHRRAAAVIGPRGLEAPLSASDEVLAAIGPLSAFMVVHSAIELPGAASPAAEVEGDPTPHLHIIPVGAGFRLELFVRPFGDRGPWLKPGVGAANLIADIEGRRLGARRDLALEEARAREVEESCPMLDLATDMAVENRHEWRLTAPEDCLQVLLELDAVRDRVALDWPEGERLSIRRRVGAGSLNLNIRGVRQDWFALSGRIQVDEDTVVELRYLLEQTRQGGGMGGRFIPLGEGRFLALTQEFRNRLDELAHYGTLESSGELRVHALAALALEELAGEAQVTADAAWQARREALAAVELKTPKAPSALKAELRDYQHEGFVWMARLAALGFGACLADDMGLGKTVQAIALILSRAKEGPTLVVAPTSVCMNWQAELRRFAPSLAPRLLADEPRGGGYAPGPFSVVVASYTLLQQEADLLAGVQWRTIVLDEAQAIKNAATKRSKAAMRLSGGFKLITTGTPIENHLGELWNLFAFINPGLLGSYKQFNRRFGIPIEKHRDRAAARMLKKLIRPFTLRRIKSEVLDELPPRTEVSLRVELGPEERAFYEALRREALENIETGMDQSARQLRILAEIMRLRRACCNPRLVDENLAIASSKEQVFAELVDDLMGGGHKALVFSQFTGHLAFLRRLLDERGIGYCYLDGSTPAARRREQVEAFQAGEAALFLISLKAGGLGLNLTAADYVIHMDPWWNPAVEDQAADRAHRIGQQRPVTVYRLVTADTIEEKIVRLHQEKRDLAHSLLEGSDACARIDIDELLELIRGE